MLDAAMPELPGCHWWCYPRSSIWFLMEIRGIDIRSVEVRDIRIPSWMTNQPRLPSAPPVTVQVGVPVIDIPGCVEAHIDNKKGTNDNLVEDDPKGARVFCDGNMPSFNPIDGMNPEKMVKV